MSPGFAFARRMQVAHASLHPGNNGSEHCRTFNGLESYWQHHVTLHAAIISGASMQVLNDKCHAVQAD
jgi:hypothetical protein